MMIFKVAPEEVRHWEDYPKEFPNALKANVISQLDPDGTLKPIAILNGLMMHRVLAPSKTSKPAT